MSEPLRVVLVGAGGMGRAWLRTILADDEVELAGVVDLDLDVARAAAAEAGVPDVPLGRDAVELARATGADAVVNVTVPRAHHPVTTAALFAGLPVLGEKPVAEDVAQALSLVAAAEVTGRMFVVSQSRRYNAHLHAFREQARVLGDLGVLTTEFFKAPRFGGFREEMAHPLLLDMAIHPFDTARFLLGAEPVSVYCEEFNPSWSWYAGDAAASAVFEMTGGVRYVYTGSWCSPGLETSWNGAWRLSGSAGTARWDGDSAPVLETTSGRQVAPAQDPGREIAGSLRAFTRALRAGTTPHGEVHENVMSLVMVEAAVASAEAGARVLVDDVLERAHERALAGERREDVRSVLASWTSVREALAVGASVPGAQPAA
ncbi:Gfo/Idh/MocA family oxidoreductase [Paenibacillus sp. TRM 82003]|uniref:Gfo/Idh/MocA family protein n=1 Tax=Kineococcus sp. TRM81007 TaxID=2925831 RepID=UPI001F55F8B9|nr:Gfo/Idh/MocA family oxidoreductase [Kineococcus sp. TRM81007]MCI2239592.1 Gfo/Idh/MocA family oxidoreductase [Kineococcus sp. TRM81007]MCI3926126.1 Gfo/Idh/MocA family oxidoreductase [Paenibacillus sp. TRM 82003]